MDYVDKIGSLKAGQCYILISMLLDTISLFAFLKNLIQRIYCRSEAQFGFIHHFASFTSPNICFSTGSKYIMLSGRGIFFSIMRKIDTYIHITPGACDPTLKNEKK